MVLALLIALAAFALSGGRALPLEMPAPKPGDNAARAAVPPMDQPLDSIVISGPFNKFGMLASRIMAFGDVCEWCSRTTRETVKFTCDKALEKKPVEMRVGCGTLRGVSDAMAKTLGATMTCTAGADGRIVEVHFAAPEPGNQPPAAGDPLGVLFNWSASDLPLERVCASMSKLTHGSVAFSCDPSIEAPPMNFDYKEAVLRDVIEDIAGKAGAEAKHTRNDKGLVVSVHFARCPVVDVDMYWDALQARDYPGAVALCRKALVQGSNRATRVRLIRALAAQGLKEDALAELARVADEIDIPSLADSEYLAPLRDDARFNAIRDRVEKKNRESLAHLKARIEAGRQLPQYEQGESIPGVKTVEGNPADGLRWRLRMSPAATPAAPNRLIVWLHPSGSSMNQVVERLAPELNKRGFALLVPTQKVWAGWDNSSATLLLNGSVPDAGRVPGVDADRPLLMGFSAGGQQLLAGYFVAPGRFGGLIAVAAAPTDGWVGRKPDRLLMPPASREQVEAFRATPMLVLVGTKEWFCPLWEKAGAIYRAAGMPLTLVSVKDAGHQWLLEGEQLKVFYEWLDNVKRQKTTPGAAGRDRDRAN